MEACSGGAPLKPGRGHIISKILSAGLFIYSLYHAACGFFVSVANLFIKCALPTNPPPPESSKLSDFFPGKDIFKGKVTGFSDSLLFLNRLCFPRVKRFKASAKKEDVCTP